jgi:hypothetical protein
MERPQIAKFPGAEGRIWKSQDGRIGLVFANFLEREVEFSWEAATALFDLKPGKYRLRENGIETAIDLGTKLIRSERLAPLGFKLVELLP